MGAEESKIANMKNAREKSIYPFTQGGQSYYAKNYTISSNSGHKNKNTSDTRVNRANSKDIHQDLVQNNRKYDEKENRLRQRQRHASNDILERRRHKDRVPSRDQWDSEDPEPRRRNQQKKSRRKTQVMDKTQTENLKKIESKTKSSNSNAAEKKKKKITPDSKSPSPNRKHKSGEKPSKTGSCLPNVSQVRRRKKKASLEKHKQAHRSAPDLSNDDMSRVGAWLNSNSFYWPPEGTPWAPPYPFSYGSLPKVLAKSRSHVDNAVQPRPIVDGMGSPVGTLYPDGTFVPEITDVAPQTEGNNQIEIPIPFRYSMPPFFQAPYPYIYPAQAPYYALSQTNISNEYQTNRNNDMNRSRSHDHIESAGNRINQKDRTKITTSRNKEKKKHKGSRLSLLDKERNADSTSSHHSSAQINTGEYYSDIAETRASIDNFVPYTANRQISVDNVQHAVIPKIKTPDVSSSDSDFSAELSDSSCNDIELDTHDVGFLNRQVNPNTSINKKKSKTIHVFQPLSKREVFIDDDDVPVKRNEKPKSSIKFSESRKSPIMKLGEKESIVATSFILEGSKVFCLTKTTQTSPHLQARVGTSSKKRAESEITRTDISPKDTNLFDSTKRNSGTWFGFTGSQSTLKASDLSDDERQKVLTKTTSSTSSITQPKKEYGNTQQSLQPNYDLKVSHKTFAGSLSRNLKVDKNLEFPSQLKKAPSPKPRLNRTETMRSTTEQQGTAVIESTTGRSQISSPSHSSLQARDVDVFSSHSSDDEPRLRDEDVSLTRKLIRIDSRDSFTMKRRKYHRRSSSLTDKIVSRHESLDRNLTNAFISAGDSSLDPNKLSKQTKKTTLHEGASMSPSSSTDKEQPFIDALLHKAKSEEILKHEMSRSSEALLSDLTQQPKKETLQERAARILGLSAEHVRRVKEKQASEDSESSYRSDDEPDQPTIFKSKLANASRTKLIKDDISISKCDTQDCESFAVSVTDSMLNKVQTIEIKNLDSNSSSDVTSISGDSNGTTQNISHTLVPNAEYLIEISDSVLEDTTVPCIVKPHQESEHISIPKEYKLPENVLNQTKEIMTVFPSSPIPTSAQASIVASYTDSIYDRVLVTTELSHSSEISDDTSETESLDHSRQLRELSKESSQNIKLKSKTDDETFKDHENQSQDDYYSGRHSSLFHHNQSRDVSSPLPISSHSAPLTHDELEIVKQLYCHSDIGSSGIDSVASSVSTTPNVDPLKTKVAQAIGFNASNIGRGISNYQKNEVNLEPFKNVYNKAIPNTSTGNQSNQNIDFIDKKSDSSGGTRSNDVSSDVEEVMHSLGINPEKSWLVDL